MVGRAGPNGIGGRNGGDHNTPVDPRTGRFGPTDTSRDTEVARLHAEGKGRNDIVRELGMSFGKVSSTARRLGLSFDGSGVLLATEARRREAADRRAELSLALLDDVDKLRDRLFNPIIMIQYVGKDGIRVQDTFDQPIPHDQAALARAATMLLDRAVKLDEYDRIGGGLETAINFLDGVTVTIRGEATVVPEIEEGDRPEPGPGDE